MHRLDRLTRPLLIAGIAGVTLYVGTWFLLGLVSPGYDPLRQAISELFDLGAPAWRRLIVQVVLVLTGLALMPLGFALDRSLPGRGRLAAWMIFAAGLGTTVVAFFPCTAGCPGYGASFTDTMHVVWAGGGYVGLVLAPLVFGLRLRGTDARRLAIAGIALGGLATAGFVLRNVGVDAFGGLQQRVFNTAADLWFLLAAVEGLRRLRAGQAAAGVTAAGADERDPNASRPAATKP